MASSSPIVCSNCGKENHLQRECKDPLTSYGVICYKDFGSDGHSDKRIIMIRRKDTIGYVEFLRGKFNVDNDEYIIKLMNLMTNNEKGKLIAVFDFDKLRNMLGMAKKSYLYKNEYESAKMKFNTLKNKKVDNISKLEYLLKKSNVSWTETEWGIPKGRKHQKESNINCAVREFLEETGLHSDDISLLVNVKPLEEIYISINNVKYKHVYYIAKFIGEDSKLTFNPTDKNQMKEISNIKWFNLEKSVSCIRPYYEKKKEVITKGFQLIELINKNCDYL
jgi:8-oxo-dGTP pyrophosphatase MutT (NUDIX family)